MTCVLTTPLCPHHHQELGQKLHTINADVADISAMQAAISSLPEDFKNVDVLVNNAGLALGLGPADKADLSDWFTMIDVNIKVSKGEFWSRQQQQQQ